VPDDAIVIFSAHGVSRAVQLEATRRHLKVFDATCPLVTKVHIEVTRYAREGIDAILIGHQGHPEVEGTMGQYDRQYGGTIYLVEDETDVQALTVPNPDKLAFVTQTTLSMDDTARVIDALRSRFPRIEGPRKDDICYATQNRQDAVRDLANRCEVVLVVGSPNSSNSNRLRELAERVGTAAYLVDNAEQMNLDWFKHAKTVGVTAGASAPEILIDQVIARLCEWGAQLPLELAGRAENVVFSLPRELRIPVLQS
jgi:4-hydroxy-3-methylbut-2-enyl diphosphate reductase